MFGIGISLVYLSHPCEHTNTPAVDLGLSATWAKGSVAIGWELPPDLEAIEERVKVELNWGEGWVEVEDGAHTVGELDSTRDYVIHVRVTSGTWVGSTSVELAAVELTTPQNDAVGPSKALEIGLLYGIIFGSLLIACCFIVLIILILKYVQMTRREGDKGECGRG